MKPNYCHFKTLTPRVALCLLSAISLLSLVDCAKVADPLPPLILHPETVSDISIVKVGDLVQVVFPLPESEFEWVEIYRECGATLDPEKNNNPFTRIKRSQLSEKSVDNKFVFQDFPEIKQRCSYGIRFVNQRERRSAFSNIVQTSDVQPAKPPSGLESIIYEDKIVLTWKAPTQNIDGSRPPHISGYLINSKHFVHGVEFIDLDFDFGKERSYRVQTVTQQKPSVLSEMSDPLQITPEDSFSPAAPQNIVSLSQEGTARILWDANRELDLSGYFVYKGTGPDRLQKSSPLITISNYQDRHVESGSTYYYRISAIDQAGNESPPSETVEVTITSTGAPRRR